MQSSAPGTNAAKIPPAIWALGFVSLLMDVSSELIHSLLPVFMVASLGASMLVVGLIEGAAEAIALIVKVFSGVISDWWGRRKPLAVLGYGLGALSKPLFALATSVEFVVTARLIDRVGKGIRSAPRDALVADIAPPALRGEAFGLRQSRDTVGAFLGPLLALGLVALIAADAALAYANHWAWVWAGACLWGLHLGATQGLLAALVLISACARARLFERGAGSDQSAPGGR
ncbi:MAG: MFS transporter [Betaproteobacteria bacterium]|nr:MFS transporter [Betaproteobacteria bacterium]